MTNANDFFPHGDSPITGIPLYHRLDVERMEKEKEEQSLKDSNTNCNDRRGYHL